MMTKPPVQPPMYLTFKAILPMSKTPIDQVYTFVQKLKSQGKHKQETAAAPAYPKDTILYTLIPNTVSTNSSVTVYSKC